MAALWDEVKDRLNAPAVSLSGGQQQRLCIARALAVQPEVLLMDEPASALDPLATSKIEDLIRELRKDYTIIIVTHNMQQAARISDHTAFFYMGELVEFGPTSQIIHQSQTEAHRRLRDRTFRLSCHSKWKHQLSLIWIWIELKQKLLTMASHAETAVNEALRALLERDYELALRVKGSDNVIDQLEVEIDEMAIHLLAKAPLASDLRLVAVAMKISQNLERVGDEATKIAKRARDLSQEPPFKVVIPIPRMAELALEMLQSGAGRLCEPATRRCAGAHPTATRKWTASTNRLPTISRNHMVENPDTISAA